MVLRSVERAAARWEIPATTWETSDREGVPTPLVLLLADRDIFCSGERRRSVNSPTQAAGSALSLLRHRTSKERGERLIWVFAILCLSIWAVYLGLGPAIAEAFARASRAGVRRLYWLLPVGIAIVCVWLFSLVDSLGSKKLEVDAGVGMFAGFSIFGLIYQALISRYIFRCAVCSVTLSTYPQVWRRGVYSCPACSSHYVAGVLGVKG
jgi:hypothetical protein